MDTFALSAARVLLVHQHCTERVAEFTRLLDGIERQYRATYPWIKISNCSGVLPDYKAGYVSDVDGLVMVPAGINYWELKMGESTRYNDDDKRLHRACYYFHAADRFGVDRKICIHATNSEEFYGRYSKHFTNSSMLLRYPGAVAVAFWCRIRYGEKTEVAIVHAIGRAGTIDPYVVWMDSTESLEKSVRDTNDKVIKGFHAELPRYEGATNAVEETAKPARRPGSRSST